MALQKVGHYKLVYVGTFLISIMYGEMFFKCGNISKGLTTHITLF